ncbi:MAG: O-antigen ligase family protein [Ruminococcaceae bacterium]|nr:O-antigen ligase family protein [Oscillospiraceae bacterium]
MSETVKELYTKKSPIFIGLYIFCIFGAAMGDYKVLNVALGALPKVVSAGALGIAFLYVLFTGNFKNFKALSRFGILFSSIIIGIIFCSILIWVLDLQDFSYIMKGVSKISYQLLNILIVLSAAYMFEENAAKYTFIGIASANFVIIALGAASTGIGGAISDMIANITSFGDNDVITNSAFIRAIEIHDITFTMGVFFIYFLFFCPREKYRYLYAGIALFLFFAGLKRIAFLSLFLGVAFAMLCKLFAARNQRRILMLTALLIVALCYFYIIIIQKGIFTQFLLEHEIEMNGREKIYDYISNFYEVSPSYRGKGYEFCVQLLKSMKDTKDQVVNITAVHNDILKMYVEMGFWGFLLWILGYYVFQTHWYITRCGEKVAVCFMAINVYMLITYMTDNTMFYYWSSMVIRIIPLSFFFDPVKEAVLKSEDRWRMNPIQKYRYNKRVKDKKQQLKPRMRAPSPENDIHL